MTEDQLVAAIAERLAGVAPQRLLVGIGDDAAVWQPSRSARSVITTDALVAGVHFDDALMGPEEIGHRVLAANLSDVAAMGARPILATVALGLAVPFDPAWVLGCYDGIAALARRTKCAIAGGDIVRAPAPFFSVTVVGEVRASNLKTRDGGRHGDVVAVTGPLGASRAGLELARTPALGTGSGAQIALRAFRSPEPRLAEGKWLGASRHVRAMMDCSDGLSTDLARLCAASGCGATIDDVPVHPAAGEIAASAGADPRRWALDGGEDFELLVAIDKRAFAHLAERFRGRFGRALLRIGTLGEGAGLRLANGESIAPSGWDHLH